ncbi:GyrI-like domain-containing protein [Paenibacillus guangzhouensis]|uniref:GyrI-like domain-containing protein n=1 Tax=Paenibacillus guangzhouensis TaxID=1473112 RepID=UPI0012672DFB|nr:GyrI-like domain-containing protein [Paenibacillus guangzhouensis]
MNVVELQEVKLVGLRVLCPGDQYIHEIPKAMSILKNRLNEIKDITKPIRFIGAFQVADHAEEEDGYWACIEVNQIRDVPDGMVHLVVPPQKYAVMTHLGPNNEIRETYHKLHHWIESNQYERVLNAWHLEISASDVDQSSNMLEVDLYDTIK